MSDLEQDTEKPKQAVRPMFRILGLAPYWSAFQFTMTAEAFPKGLLGIKPSRIGRALFNRTTSIITGVAVVAVLAVTVLMLLPDSWAPGPVAEQVAKAPETEGQFAAAPATAPETSAAEAPDAPAPVLPSFDLVRVERSGEAVIVGRAAPGSVVTVFAGKAPLGRATADLAGQWVLVLDVPLAPGDHEIALKSSGAGGVLLLSENVVVVSVP